MLFISNYSSIILITTATYVSISYFFLNSKNNFVQLISDDTSSGVASLAESENSTEAWDTEDSKVEIDKLISTTSNTSTLSSLDNQFISGFNTDAVSSFDSQLKPDFNINSVSQSASPSANITSSLEFEDFIPNTPSQLVSNTSTLDDNVRF